MDRVRQSLGLATGGANALIAMAQLMGGDYDATGVDNVGQAKALQCIQTLLLQEGAQVRERVHGLILAGERSRESTRHARRVPHHDMAVWNEAAVMTRHQHGQVSAWTQQGLC